METTTTTTTTTIAEYDQNSSCANVLNVNVNSKHIKSQVSCCIQTQFAIRIRIYNFFYSWGHKYFARKHQQQKYRRMLVNSFNVNLRSNESNDSCFMVYGHWQRLNTWNLTIIIMIIKRHSKWKNKNRWHQMMMNLNGMKIALDCAN